VNRRTASERFLAARDERPTFRLALVVVVAAVVLVAVVLAVRMTKRAQPPVEQAPAAVERTGESQAPESNPTPSSDEVLSKLKRLDGRGTDEDVARLKKEFDEAQAREADAMLEEKVTQLAKQRLEEKLRPFYAAGGKSTDDQLQRLLDAERVVARGLVLGMNMIVKTGIREGYSEQEVKTAIRVADDREALRSAQDERQARWFLEQSRSMIKGSQQIDRLK
jgi:hypothetical protein